MNTLLSNYLHGAGTLQAVRAAGDFEALCLAVREDRAGRLRWKLHRRLGLTPWTGAPGRDEYLYALAQFQADLEEAMENLCPACRERTDGARCRACGAAIPTENPDFDESRFEELKHDGSAL